MPGQILRNIIRGFLPILDFLYFWRQTPIYFSPAPFLLFFDFSFSLKIPDSILFAEIGAKERNGEHTVPEIWGHPEVNGFVPADRN